MRSLMSCRPVRRCVRRGWGFLVRLLWGWGGGIRGRVAENATRPGIDTLLRRLQGVLVARQWVMLDYDIPVTDLERATLVAPGVESPTVSPLHDPEWVAVRVMIRADTMNQVMDQLYALGARAILVSQIHAARL